MNVSVASVANNPTAKKQIKDALIEISASLTRAEAERDLITNIVENVCEDHGLDPKVFRKMARTYHKQNFKEEVQGNRDFEDFYESIVENVAVIEHGEQHD